MVYLRFSLFVIETKSKQKILVALMLPLRLMIFFSEIPILYIFHSQLNVISHCRLSLFGIAQKVTKKASPSDKKLENLQPCSV
jgi:hypothetical protein